MNMKFFPESYNFKLMNEKGLNKELFFKLQIKYKNDFEKLLMKIIDFKKLDDYINSYGYNIPFVDDFDYNFYHKYSVLGSKYIFFRNNIHIENLSTDEITVLHDCLEKNKDLDINFLIATFKKVIYEEGDAAMYGLSTPSNIVPSKSLVFEFAYDQKKITDISQYNFVNQIKNTISNYLTSSIVKVLNTEVFLHTYKAIPDIYATTNEKFRI